MGIRRPKDEGEPFNETNGARGTRLVSSLCSFALHQSIVRVSSSKEGRGSSSLNEVCYDRPVCQSRLGGGDARLKTPMKRVRTEVRFLVLNEVRRASDPRLEQNRSGS